MEVTIKPTVGRIVHYLSYGTKNGEYSSQCRAAVVTEVGQWVTVGTAKADSYSASEGRPIRSLEQWWYSDACSLSVLNPTGVFFGAGGVPIRYDGNAVTPGTWHWPERAEESAQTHVRGLGQEAS